MFLGEEFVHTKKIIFAIEDSCGMIKVISYLWWEKMLLSYEFMERKKIFFQMKTRNKLFMDSASKRFSYLFMIVKAGSKVCIYLIEYKRNIVIEIFLFNKISLEQLLCIKCADLRIVTFYIFSHFWWERTILD